MKTPITLEIDDLELSFTPHPAEPKTWDYPGANAEIELHGLSYKGIEFPQDLFDAICKDYKNGLVEAGEDEACSREDEDAVAHAEHMRDAMEDR